MIQVKHIKKVTSFLLILVTALLLVACSKEENVPYGNINLESKYLTVGDTHVTEKDVYDTLRRQGGSLLPQLFEEKLFEDLYGKKANSLLGEKNPEEDSEAFWAQEEFDKVVNKKIFSTDDAENIKDMPVLRRTVAVEKYIDSIFSNPEVTVSRSELQNIILGFIDENKDDDYATGYSSEQVFINLYGVEIQKLLYAKEILDEEILDEDSDNYIEERHVVTYYKNNIKKQHDVNAFFFPFFSTEEANTALREVGLKSNSRGHWFRIPDIRLVGVYDEFKDDKTDYLWDVLDNLDEDLNIKDKFENVNKKDETKTQVTDEMYIKFYESYSPTESNSGKISDVEVLRKFVEAYNVVNLKQLQPVPLGDGDSVLDYEIKYESGEKYQTAYSYDDITEVSSTLRNYIYDTLTEKKPYSTLRSIGSLRYLVFKLDEDYNELNFVSEEKDEDDFEKFVAGKELKDILDDEEHDKRDDLIKALNKLEKDFFDGTNLDVEKFDKFVEENVNEWKKELVDTKLTSSYTSSKVSELYDEDKTKIEIYDDIIRIYYNQSAPIKAKGKNQKGNDVAKITFVINDEKHDVLVTVDEVYDYLDKYTGLETALDLLLNELLLAEYKKGKNGIFKDEEIKEKDFKKELKDMINAFSSDQFAQAGYPASLGRETFMLLLFGSRDRDKAIEFGYLIPKLRELFLENEEIHISDSVDVNNVFQTFAEKQYNEFKGVSVSHLLVYFDENGDGNPDNPNEYLEKLSEEDRKLVLDGIVSVYTNMIKLLSKPGYEDLSETKFQAIISKFQETSRIPTKVYFDEEYESFLNDYEWMYEARKLGINLKFENLGSEITNTSNFITGSSTLDPVFYDRAIALRDMLIEIKDFDEEDPVELKELLPYFDFGFDLQQVKKDDVIALGEEYASFAELNTDVLEDELMSDFGFHFILVDSISETVSAKYDESKDPDKKYIDKDDDKLNAYNEDDIISKTQIEYYLKNKDNKDGLLLPSSVKQAIDTYLSPVIELYESSNTKTHLVYKYLLDQNVVFNKDGSKAKFDILVDINISKLHSYLNGTDFDGNIKDENYNNLYSDLFEALGLEISK